MRKINIGDRVKIVAADIYNLERYIGTIGEIGEICDEGTDDEHYKVFTHDNDYWWFGPEQLEEAHP